jgi:hypothetical protein
VSEEPVAGTEPFEPGRHFVACPFEQLAETIAEYVKDPGRCAAIVTAARSCLDSQPDLARIWRDRI